MKESIIELIGNELARLFPQIPIYRESQKAGFKDPSFFLHKIMTQVTPNLLDYQFRRYSYQLVYLPNPAKPKTDIEHMEELLLNNFTALPGYATIRNREFEPNDENVLLMTFQVWLRAQPIDNTPKQKSITVKEGVAHERK
ncbi:phage tail terminator family protein [Agrilactobacillus composti]|uniref:phage tail terminator family protein n=1 Tax=Agrilactobacillus composti TaxID=398555 RepID=UPI0006894011|nr:hypothetical protein [Agrilactobacillus composti]